MVLNLLFFTVKIERAESSMEMRIAESRRDQYLKAREEAFALEAAQYPDFVSRI